MNEGSDNSNKPIITSDEYTKMKDATINLNQINFGLKIYVTSYLNEYSELHLKICILNGPNMSE